MADSFVDSAGVDTHWNYGKSTYRTSYSTIESALVSSGIRHIRDGGFGYTNPQALASLAASGISHSASFPINVTAAQITANLQGYGSAVDFVETQNEYDESDENDPNWPAEVIAEQKLIYATVKSNPAFSSITVLGPSFGHPADATKVGPLDAYEDDGNEHDYTCNYNPGTAASSGIGNITSLLRQSTVTKPIWTTEVGYADNLTNWGCGLSDATIAKYDPRVLAVRWLFGMPRTYFYQFADTAPDLNYDSMGLVTATGAPKPQYKAIQSLLSLLSDRGSSFTPEPLAVAIGGNVANVDHLLFQKRDGSYYLMLWLEVPGWNAVTESPVSPPAQTVTLTFGSTPSAVAQYSYTSNWSLGSTALPATPTQSISVGDSITIVRIQP